MPEPDDIAVRIRACAASVRAPASLRAAVAAGPRQAPRRDTRPAWLIGLGGATVACVVAVVLVIAPAGSQAPALSVADAAGLALRAPAGSGRPVGGGDYGAASGWRAVGTSTARLGDRAAVTVAYGGSDSRVVYSVVEGPALTVPPGARRIVYEGLPVALVERGGLRIVTWRRGGRTCIVAARGTSLDRLLDLAART